VFRSVGLLDVLSSRRENREAHVVPRRGGLTSVVDPLPRVPFPPILGGTPPWASRRPSLTGLRVLTFVKAAELRNKKSALPALS